jgi:hypothetical protein
VRGDIPGKARGRGGEEETGERMAETGERRAESGWRLADGGKDSHGGTGMRRIKIIAGIRFENGVEKNPV